MVDSVSIYFCPDRPKEYKVLVDGHKGFPSIKYGWNRPRARDYYDLWRILRDFGPSLKNIDLSGLLRRKSAHRGVSYNSLDDFFTADLEAEARRNWESNL